MTTSAKIRLLLALLFASLLLTAVIVQKTYTPKNNLYQTGQTLEDNLHKKEAYVNSFLNNKESFNKLKTLGSDEQEALKTIKAFTTDENIWALTYKDNHLVFWSGVKIIPQHPALIHEGYSFVSGPNGYYDVIKKSEGKFSAIFFIPVKISYRVQNQYLHNTFAKNLLNDTNIEIADFTDRNVYEVHSLDGTYLFSVKVKHNEVGHKFFYFEVVIWILCALVLFLLVHSICNYIALKGYIYLSFLILAAFIALLRILNLHYGWPGFSHQPDIFNPQYYNSGKLFPSLGDFCINILYSTWFVTFVYRHKDKVLPHSYNKFIGYVIVVVFVLILDASSTSLLRLFYGLVRYSNINFDVNNVLNLSGFSVLGVLMLCFSFLIFYFLTEISLTVCSKLVVPVSHQIAILLFTITVSTIVSGYLDNEFTIFYIFWAVWVILRGYAYRYDQGRITAASLVTIILLCAVLSAIKLNHFQAIKEKETRKELVKQLEAPNDPVANNMFKDIDKRVVTDPVIQRYFADTIHNTVTSLADHIQRKYFDGYLGKYEFKVHEYNDKGEALGDKAFDLSVFKDMIKFESFFKESDHFYRNIGTFGVLKYLALLPIFKGDSNIGTIVVELESKFLEGENTFPALLIDGIYKSNDLFKDYSYAFYQDNKLLSQNGQYVYSLINHDLKGSVKEYLYYTTRSSEPSRFGILQGYSHLIYEPSKRTLIVVSKENDTLINTITSVTFFFIVFLFFGVICITVKWLWGRIRIMYIKDNYLHWVFRLNFDKVLYKTRIQLSIVFAVVVTLIMVGIITYLSIVDQYNAQQEQTISNKISHIAKAFESSSLIYEAFNDNSIESFQLKFNEFAKTYSADLTLFNTSGVELVSTQPKLYDYGLLAPRINAKAYTYLNKLQKSEYIHNEIIGELNYKAAYVPIKDTKRTLGYLQLPYFSNEADYKERAGSLLNAMINVYALIFIAIGLLAVFIARRITNPLNIIQMSLSKTIYGQNNEPIKWQRNDEIGALITEYNNMIAALEQSAQKLAQSERESAWREMAKQVAHEIKNPLTPLKLGLQLLEKSWRDKDPKFDQKFERFSKSFVEQIESLSSIASEFSAFAKMPDTRIVRMDIFEALNQAVTIFKQMDNIRIVFNPPDSQFFINADRDQLLRCFNNLLKNAIEAMPHDRFGIIEINYLITSKNILLSVKDNGNGIPENLREKIFEPNFTTKSSGTGLGLAFVKNSIENAGGKVWFETIMDTGTTFYFSLPEAS
ncbi:MAG TPA: ATP-binding protein [Mucilaginibacter sp.]|nr:ATP-binding protein [Mucilaginibacter sp.]